ncbi:hypothetical protein DACRYDRAFT_103849 [Dacryopinax primogenitus]|uniref:Pre-rRNA-processing protein PNO1 n=1 Tax=Dacryopinax primogenitus (strain DJM 731) TaxID=1858805 RepID=M5GGE8_DACPD|nr:uncharacterized protein DACRYDRAFT_103849 [Dacryopinax primogenitus]EJU05363.1 hypothetical protein DACRYDRAFT_103849 [Dacryopinax primogenitus]
MAPSTSVARIAASSLKPKKATRQKSSMKEAFLPTQAGGSADEDVELDEDRENWASMRLEDAPEMNQDEVMIDDAAVPTERAPQIPSLESAGPSFPPLSAAAQRVYVKTDSRKIAIPPHRMTPIKKDWVHIFTPLVEMLGLQVRMNTRRGCVELRSSKHTDETGALQKGAEFVKAYALGFDVNDCLAILRMDDLYIDTFEIKDVKTLHGDHLSRAIGRIAGQDGKTKFTIENATRTRIVLAETKIHILGSFQNIKIARDAISNLILGSPPGKVYASLRVIGARMKQRAF